MTLHDVGIVERELGINYFARDHLLWLCEVMLVMAVGASKRDHGCYRIPAPPRAPGPLLVVSTARGHVTERDARKRAAS